MSEPPQSNQLFFAGLHNPRILLSWMYHDEMKPERGVLPITGHGSLMAPDAYRRAFYVHLQMLRDGYEGRIHSTKIQNDRGPMFEVGARWIDAFFTELIEHASFKATFAFHNGPLYLPYPGDEGFQQHWVMSTKSNLIGHIRWVLTELDLLGVRPVFDGSGDAREEHYLRWGVERAQFEINERRRKGKPYPATFFSDVDFHSSDHRHASSLDDAINAEFLQLTDLLLGAAADALEFRPGAHRNGRRRLARHVSEQIAVRYGYRPFAFQQHLRHFSVSLYPDARGRMYAATTTKSVRTEGTQRALFV